MPQIYWEIGNKAADYKTLINWWNNYSSKRPLFIGEDVERTVKYADLTNPYANQMAAKYKLHSQMKNVNGTVLWYAKAVVDNVGNYGTLLRSNYWRNRALQPAMPFIDGKAPQKPKKVKMVKTDDGPMLFWTEPKGDGWKDKATRYVVYRFENGEKVDLGDASKIVSMTTKTFYRLPYKNGKNKVTFVVTALDRMSNESDGVAVNVKL